jgi:hypothetical protein
MPGGQHLLDHSQAQREAEIQPDRVAVDLGWKAVTGVSVRGEHRHTGRIPAAARHGNPAIAKLTVPGHVRQGRAPEPGSSSGSVAKGEGRADTYVLTNAHVRT